MITLDPRTVRPRPLIYRPSVMASFADAASRARFLELPGPLGYVRHSFSWALAAAKDETEYLRLARNTWEQEMLPFTTRGAILIAGFGATPRWLSPHPEQTEPTPGGVPRFSTYKPTNLDAYGSLAQQTAEITQGQCWWEQVNEPDSGDLFWSGTFEKLLETCGAARAGIRRVYPDAVVGGPAFGHPLSQLPDGSPWLLRWLERDRTPGFVNWHLFTTAPTDGVDHAAQVRAWLAQTGHPTSLPQVTTETARWATWPAWLDPFRDAPACIAHDLATLHAAAAAGISGCCRATLQDFSDVPFGAGEFGLFSKRLEEKPAFAAQRALASLSDVLCAAEIPPPLAAMGVGIIASVKRPGEARGLRALLVRADPDPAAPDVELELRIADGVVPPLAVKLAPYSARTITLPEQPWAETEIQ